MDYNTLKVINGISKKIYELFGDSYNIETSEVPQDFNKPAFFIKEINDKEKHYRGPRYSSNKSFVIYGFAKDDTDEELYEMGEKLYNLEYIKLEDNHLLRGIDKSFRVENKILIFLVDFNTFVYKNTDNSEKMKKIFINEEVNNNV